jgi:hypothetical protein
MIVQNRTKNVMYANFRNSMTGSSVDFTLKNIVAWRSLLLEHFDEKEAFKKCFEYINEFKIRKFSLIAEIRDIMLRQRSANSEEEKETIYTTTIRLGKYTQDPGYWVKFKKPDISRLSGFYNDIEFFESLIGISREDWIFSHFGNVAKIAKCYI